jgi:hypothetical protein
MENAEFPSQFVRPVRHVMQQIINVKNKIKELVIAAAVKITQLRTAVRA